MTDAAVVCYLLRHADAGKRTVVDDAERHLSGKGRAQAERLATSLGSHRLDRVISSPYTRCVETVEPLVRATGTTLEINDALGEGAGPATAIEWVEAATAPLLLCSHGDVIGDMLTLLARRGISLDDDRLAKASTWEIAVDHGTIRSAHYVAPPT